MKFQLFVFPCLFVVAPPFAGFGKLVNGSNALEGREVQMEQSGASILKLNLHLHPVGDSNYFSPPKKWMSYGISGAEHGFLSQPGLINSRGERLSFVFLLEIAVSWKLSQKE